MALGRLPLNCRASLLFYFICSLTLVATNNHESVGHNHPAMRGVDDDFAIEYYLHRRILDPCTWHVSDSGHLGFFFRRKFIRTRVPYCAFHTAQFNISLLIAHGDVHPHPGPRNDASNTLNTSSYQTTVMSSNTRTSNNTCHLPIKLEPWLAHFNCRSIMAHIDELRLTFQDIRPLFIGISETWLDDSISDSEIELSGYSVYRHDRKNRRGGGVALYVLENVKHTLRRDLEDDFEAIWIEMQLNKVKYLIGCVYRAPDKSLEVFDYLDDVMRVATRSNLEVIVIGDLNCDIC